VAEIIRRAVGFNGTIDFDLSKPDGTPRKLMDTAKLSSLGWQPGVALEEGIRTTYEHFVRDVAAPMPIASPAPVGAERVADALITGLRSDAIGIARKNIIHSIQP
jgi:hypothetical protein